MDKAKLGIVSMLLLVMATMSVAAYNPDGTVWRANSAIGLDDINSIGGETDFIYAKGKVNARMVNTRGFQAEGVLTIKALTADRVRKNVQVKWSSHYAGYGVEILEDTDTKTKLSANARVTGLGSPEFRTATIIYYKNTGNIDVNVAGLNINQVEPTVQCYSFARYTFCRHI